MLITRRTQLWGDPEGDALLAEDTGSAKALRWEQTQERLRNRQKTHVAGECWAGTEGRNREEEES